MFLLRMSVTHSYWGSVKGTDIMVKTSPVSISSDPTWISAASSQPMANCCSQTERDVSSSTMHGRASQQ